MKNKLLLALRDIAIALGIGFAISAVVSGISAFVGLFVGMYAGLDVAQRILFVIGALCLILLAVTIMARGKKPKFGRILNEENWTRFFRVLGFPEVAGLLGAALILGGCFLDIWLVPMQLAIYS